MRKVKLNKEVQSKYRKKKQVILIFFFLLFFLSCNIGADHDTRSVILNMKTALVVAKR